MAVKHTFTSAKSDDGDATLVRPSNWNADHEVTIAERDSAGSTTLALADEQNVVRVTAAGTVTVPPASSVAFPVGALVGVYADTTGTVTVAAGSGVTVVSRGSVFDLSGQYGEASLRYRGSDVWVLTGDLA